MRLRNLFKKLKSNPYIKYRKQPLQEHTILLEAGQGKNVNGNMFAMVRELCENPEYKNYKVVFVVSKNTEEAANERFSFYGYEVVCTIRNSEEYKEYLATSKYLMTDNSFPPYFSKREDQIYINTWHGTPLKTLGKSDIKNAKSLANIQKNYLMCDYALFPNEFTKDVFMKDYMLEHLYKGSVLLCDYPRNKALLKGSNDALRKKLGLEDKQLIAYMPTWRGSSREADAQEQKEILHAYFLQIDKGLKDHQIFYVNLHFLLGNAMEFSQYKHIKPFPPEYETYDFLGLCDLLVTDYSSVFFDFAVSEKKIVLFAYDLDEYMAERGTYFPIEDLPFPIVFDVEALLKELNDPTPFEMPQSFLHTYCNYRDEQVPKKVLDLMIHQTKDQLCVEAMPEAQKKMVLVYGGKLANKRLNTKLLEHLNQLVTHRTQEQYILCFSGTINQKKVEFLSELPTEVEYLALVSKFEFTVLHRIMAILAIRYRLFSRLFDERLQASYQQERERLLYGLTPSEVQYFAGNARYHYKVFATFKAFKIAHLQHAHLMGLQSKKSSYRTMCAYIKRYYDEVIDHGSEDIRDLWLDEEKQTYYNKTLRMGNVWYRIHNNAQGMRLSSFAIVETIKPHLIKQCKIQVAQHTYDAHIKQLMHVGRGLYLIHYHFLIPYEDVKSLEIQNRILIVYEDEAGCGLTTGIKYNLFHRRKGKNHHGPVHVFEQSNTAAYFRQTVNNVCYFTVRKKNITDSKKEQIKLFFAYYLAKVYPRKHMILLFEKESERYEESASVLYEKLIDKGYQTAYFILDASYAHIDSVPEKYRDHLVPKGSFRHYVYFFRSKTFLGSEALVHAIDLRISNKYAQRKLNDTNIDYVFLQHGVMYMVSLDSESRKFFKPKKTKGKYRVVVSSQAEANHFIDLGGYQPESIYISGLPKYDRNVLHNDADRIVIMPTWRPWEYNNARYDFTTTKYYQMIERIFHAIPKAYRDKVIILPHPLFYDAVKEADFELKAYLDHGSKYDDILKQTKVLITDYSSIAYDAFYRGSNVIFYWEEKEECMQTYGPSTKLMLNHENVFGKICYEEKELAAIFEEVYHSPQDRVLQKRYQKLVEFHDGKNTERLIQFLKDDEII